MQPYESKTRLGLVQIATHLQICKLNVVKRINTYRTFLSTWQTILPLPYDCRQPLL